MTTLTLSSETILVEEADELIAKTSPDQLVVNGIVGDGTVVSFQLRGGMNRGTAFLFEIHGDQGDLQLTATSRASMQRQELNVRGARGDEKELAELPIPGKYRWVPEGIAPDSRYNVAQLYARLAEGIRAMIAGLAIGKALGCEEDSAQLGFAFRWTGLAGRIAASWASLLGHDRFEQRKSLDPEATAIVSVPLSTAPAAVTPFVAEATRSLFAKFDGLSMSTEMLERCDQLVFDRRT